MTQSIIIAERIYNQKSNNMVWSVFITGVEEEESRRSYIADAHKALRYAFYLKADTGKVISRESVELMKLVCSLSKKSKKAEAETAENAEAETPAAEEPVAEAEAPKAEPVETPKKSRRGRKAQVKEAA